MLIYLASWCFPTRFCLILSRGVGFVRLVCLDQAPPSQPGGVQRPRRLSRVPRPPRPPPRPGRASPSMECPHLLSSGVLAQNGLHDFYRTLDRLKAEAKQLACEGEQHRQFRRGANEGVKFKWGSLKWLLLVFFLVRFNF